MPFWSTWRNQQGRGRTWALTSQPEDAASGLPANRLIAKMQLETIAGPGIAEAVGFDIDQRPCSQTVSPRRERHIWCRDWNHSFYEASPEKRLLFQDDWVSHTKFRQTAIVGFPTKIAHTPPRVTLAKNPQCEGDEIMKSSIRAIQELRENPESRLYIVCCKCKLPSFYNRYYGRTHAEAPHPVL